MGVGETVAPARVCFGAVAERGYNILCKNDWSSLKCEFLVIIGILTNVSTHGAAGEDENSQSPVTHPAVKRSRSYDDDIIGGCFFFFLKGEEFLKTNPDHAVAAPLHRRGFD